MSPNSHWSRSGGGVSKVQRADLTETARYLTQTTNPRGEFIQMEVTFQQTPGVGQKSGGVLLETRMFPLIYFVPSILRPQRKRRSKSGVSTAKRGNNRGNARS